MMGQDVIGSGMLPRPLSNNAQRHLRSAVAYIEKHPDSWDQRRWISRFGQKACLAGHLYGMYHNIDLGTWKAPRWSLLWDVPQDVEETALSMLDLSWDPGTVLRNHESRSIIAGKLFGPYEGSFEAFKLNITNVTGVEF